MPTQLDLQPSQLKPALRTAIIGREIVYRRSIPSTNDLALALAKNGAADGTVVLAEQQTAGRGRLGRMWLSPAGSNILCTVILRPSFRPEAAFLLTALCSAAIARAIEITCGLQPTLKWPNDILINDRKVVGVLTELALTGPVLDAAVVGFGINVNFDPRGHPEIGQPATSLIVETGRPVSRRDLLLRVLEEADCRYVELQAGRTRPIFEEWKAGLGTLGRHVLVSAPGGDFEGLACDVEDDGTLVVQRPDGELRRVIAGDVSIRPVQREEA
jgi:BirA family transcriptional regulator, biotin operon repressor / biotin---[acetyl-CoA-carboxylase] ligase